MQFLWSGGADSTATVLLAHGAGAPMDTPFMNAFAEGLAERRIRVARFEFGYMAARRTGAGRKPPPRAETLTGAFREAVAAVGSGGMLVIGGKSMGGRVASMIADDLFRTSRIAGLVCLGYPFHPPGKPDQLRTRHLEALSAPALICQGTRDPFGSRDEIGTYRLSPAIAFHWIEGGDHDFRTAKGSGGSLRGNWAAAVDRIADWVGELAAQP
jgi:uncharacterized protein